jgi:hypothetical protein
MKIKKCDVCCLIKPEPIVSITLPIIYDEEVELKRFDLCSSCLKIVGQAVTIQLQLEKAKHDYEL